MPSPHRDMKLAMQILKRHNRGLTFREIAKVMDLKLGTVSRSFGYVRKLSTRKPKKRLRTKKSVV